MFEISLVIQVEYIITVFGFSCGLYSILAWCMFNSCPEHGAYATHSQFPTFTCNYLKVSLVKLEVFKFKFEISFVAMFNDYHVLEDYNGIVKLFSIMYYLIWNHINLYKFKVYNEQTIFVLVSLIPVQVSTIFNCK